MNGAGRKMRARPDVGRREDIRTSRSSSSLSPFLPTKQTPDRNPGTGALRCGGVG